MSKFTLTTENRLPITGYRSPTTEMQSFTPFPLRARGLVEQFDAAIKLYKQYFWVLLGWSAIVMGASMLGAFSVGGLGSLFLTPLLIGSVVCCVAAAVRGQSVEFGQCWRFTQPRYWPLLGLHLLASFVGAIIIAVMIGAMVAIIIGGVMAFGNSSGAVQVAMGLLAFIVFGSIATIVGTVFLSWMGLVPIVVCMEDDKRNVSALNRAYDILRGHWLRITSLLALVGLAMGALFLILASSTALLVGVQNLREMFSGRSSGNDTGIILALLGFGTSYTLLMMLWTPLYYLILTVFYLDVRVRQEALDLEWTAHTTAPPMQSTPPTGDGLTPNNSYPTDSLANPQQPALEPQPTLGTNRTQPLSDTSQSPFVDAPTPQPSTSSIDLTKPAPSTPPAAGPPEAASTEAPPPEAPRSQW